ncbi:SpoIIE family protein phosphatase [bacterium]|nr:SpoIIE family protein phosphatase [bacterium]
MDPIHVTLVGRLSGRSVRFELGEGIHTLGRATSCEVQIDEPSVSRQHARIHVGNDGIFLEDLGSSNGTRVRGHEIAGPTHLEHGDEIALGNLRLLVETAEGEIATDNLFLDQTMVRENMALTLDEARQTEVASRGKRAFLFRILAEAAELLATPSSPEQLFDPLLELVEKALQPQRVVLLLRDDEDGEPEVVASRVQNDDPASLVISRTLMSRVLEDRQAFLTEDASQDERLAGGESLIGAHVRSAMAAPLFDNDAVIGILYADTRDLTVSYDRDELTAFLLLANVVGIAITQARYRETEAQRQRMATELGAARRIMSRLLPAELPTVEQIAMSVMLEPCEEVAGDLYDVRRLPDGRVMIVVGDVSGKGLPAALLVAAMLPAIRVAAEIEDDLGRVVSQINRELFAATDAVRFATLFMGLLDPTSGRLEYVNAGHNPPLLVNAGAVETLGACGPPVGMLPDLQYSAQEISMLPGAHLVLFSDGLTEAQDADEAMYGDDRLVALVRECGDCCPADLQARILADVTAFVGDAPQADDLTLMFVQREGCGS